MTERIVLYTRVPGHGSAESGDKNRHDALNLCEHFEKQRTIVRMLGFQTKNLERLMDYTVISLTNPHTKRCRAFSELVVPRILSFASVDNFERSEYIRC